MSDVGFDARNRAVRAQALVDDPLLKEGFDALKPPISRVARNEAGRPECPREALPCGQCRGKLREHLQSVIANGRIADAELQRAHAKQNAASGWHNLRDNTWTDRCPPRQRQGRSRVDSYRRRIGRLSVSETARSLAMARYKRDAGDQEQQAAQAERRQRQPKQNRPRKRLTPPSNRGSR